MPLGELLQAMTRTPATRRAPVSAWWSSRARRPVGRSKSIASSASLSQQDGLIPARSCFPFSRWFDPYHSRRFVPDETSGWMGSQTARQMPLLANDGKESHHNKSISGAEYCQPRGTMVCGSQCLCAFGTLAVERSATRPHNPPNLRSEVAVRNSEAAGALPADGAGRTLAIIVA